MSQQEGNSQASHVNLVLKGLPQTVWSELKIGVPSYYSPILWKEIETGQGSVMGLHGTAGSIARTIQKEGFENHTCAEGTYGVHFHQQQCISNAHYHGKKKAAELGETEYAVICATLLNPQVDRNERPQWVTDANSITIVKILFYPTDSV